jgi:hypothetical protein
MSSACFDHRFFAPGSFVAAGPVWCSGASPEARKQVAFGQRRRA